MTSRKFNNIKQFPTVLWRDTSTNPTMVDKNIIERTALKFVWKLTKIFLITVRSRWNGHFSANYVR